MGITFAVSLVARLEGMNKMYKVPILISDFSLLFQITLKKLCFIFKPVWKSIRTIKQYKNTSNVASITSRSDGMTIGMG